MAKGKHAQAAACLARPKKNKEVTEVEGGKEKGAVAEGREVMEGMDAKVGPQRWL